MRLLFAGYRPRGLATLWPTVMGVVASVRFLFVRLLGIFSNLTQNKVYKSASQRPLVEAEYYTCNDSLKWDDGIHSNTHAAYHWAPMFETTFKSAS